MEIEKGPVDLFPTEPTDEALQGEETLNLGFKGLFGLLIKNKDALYIFLYKKRTRNAF
ncbi:hypothetical protein [Pseudobutyrivibrio sp. MD2005]|uniref:hypothetical protein n=1 Tax=Pseudobutyrivibrio sp. MD2005 TaxID=1410616 RepID=UPI0012DC1DBF|nr:hypothetical protein [Pseudobutyrivibrio sp. MD2005]